MPQDLPEQIIAQIDTNHKPRLLFEMGLSSTLRYVADKINLVFPTEGNTYTAKAIEITNVVQSLEGQVQKIVVKFDNVTRDMAGYCHNEDFSGKSLIIKRVYVGELGNSSYYKEVFNGLMEKPTEISRYWLTVSANSGKPLNRKCLKLAYQRMCPWQFGGTECNTDGNADLTSLTASGTADSGSTTTLTHDALTQDDDYWNYGNIEITKDNVVYNRKVKDFDADTDTITFDVALPVAVDGTTTYILYKGCDQTWATCSAENAWGPSADNYLNFGGCIHITKKLDTE